MPGHLPGEAGSGHRLVRALGSQTVDGLGLGCWAIGGELFQGSTALGWGKVDDAESVRAIRSALEVGVTFFDTADIYGAGHSENILGEGLGAARKDVIVATKFGLTFDPRSRQFTGTDTTAEYVRSACEASLARLGTDWVDLYLLHVSDVEAEPADEIADSLERLCADGLIRGYGWSTDNPDMVARWLGRPNFVAVEHNCNVFDPAPEMISMCGREGLASIARVPLAMGLLGGALDADSLLPPDDVRGSDAEWLEYFEHGRPNRVFLDGVTAIRNILASGGRTVAQGALAWIWGHSDVTIPIPGFRSSAQARENAGARKFGALDDAQLAEIAQALAAAPTHPSSSKSTQRRRDADPPAQ